jgi:CheY-like chemotaxis protein
MNSDADILLIEDGETDAEVIIRALAKAKITNPVKHLVDGEEALDYIFCTGEYADRNMNAKPKLILLDLKLPKVNGIEILKMIKSDNRTKTVPVVVFTSSGEHKDILDAYDFGVNSYVVKQADYKKFSATVVNVSKYWLLLNHPSH